MESPKNNFVEREENEKNIETSSNREEKILNAERGIATMFEKKLSEVLDRIGENPYHRGFEHLS